MNSNALNRIKQWIVKTPLRSLSEAYNAALAIQAIEEKYFADQTIAPSKYYTEVKLSYFRDKRNYYLQIIRFRLAEFKVSSPIANLFYGSLQKHWSEGVEQNNEESMILEKLNIIESVLAKYEVQQQSESLNFAQTKEQQFNTLFNEVHTDFDQTGSIQRIRSGSVFDTASQLKKELSTEYEQEVLYELRSSRKRTLRAIRFLVLLILIPLIVQVAGKPLLIDPLIHHFNHSPKIVLVGEMKERALQDLARFKESLEFDTLLNDSHPPTDLEKLLKTEANRLQEHYSHESTEGIRNLMADGLSLITFTILIYFGRQQVMTLKALMGRVVFGLNDATKVFLIILFTDMFVGYHSSHGWEVLLESISEHFGLAIDRDTIFLFIATVPVMMDATLKYWIFNYLSRESPSAVAVYRTMNE